MSASEVYLYLVGDDYVTATVNNQNACYATWNVFLKCDMTSATKTGLNELKIEVENYGGPGFITYRLEVMIRF